MRRIAYAIVFCCVAAADASAVTRTFCSTDRHGTQTCHTISVRSKTTRIMGMPAHKYIRGLRRGRCMPSPSGGCGGG